MVSKAELEPVLIQTEKSCLASYERQFCKNIKIKIIKLIPVQLVRAFGLLFLTKPVLIKDVYNTMLLITILLLVLHLLLDYMYVKYDVYLFNNYSQASVSICCKLKAGVHLVYVEFLSNILLYPKTISEPLSNSYPWTRRGREGTFDCKIRNTLHIRWLKHIWVKTDL